MSEVVTDKNELPKNWELLRFDEIISPVKHAMKRGPFGSALKKSFFVPDGYKVYEQKNAIQDDAFLGKYFISDEKFAELENFKVEPGDFIVSCSGTIGRITRIPKNAKPGIINQALLKIRINNEIISSQYFLYLFRSDVFQKKVLKETRGVAIKNIASVKDIKSLPVPLPPLEQQKRIVAKIEELFSHIDAGIEALKKAKQLLKQYRQSVLKAAVTGELTKEWREANKEKLEPASQLLERILEERRRKWEEQQLEQFEAKGKVPKGDGWKGKYKEPEVLEKTPEEVLPNSWGWASIGQVFDVYVGATPSRKKPEYWNGEVNWVSSGEVAFCHIKDTKEKITNEGLNNASTVLHPPGTVMLGMIGEGKTRGQVAILDIHSAHNQNTAAIEKYIDEQSSEYLYYYLMQQYELTRKRGSGNNQKALNKTRVQSIEFPLPPLAEQKIIAELLQQKFSSIERLEKGIEIQFLKVEKNKQSILTSAFSGNVGGEGIMQ